MRAGLAAALALAMATGASQAAGPDPRDVVLTWTVVPSDAAGSKIRAKPGDIVLRQRLLPVGYAALADDAFDLKTGNLVAAKGTPMLRMQSVQGVVYCAAADPKRAGLARAKPGSPYLRACFRDDQGDGSFESSAEYDGELLPLPSVSGRLPKTMHALTRSVAYAELPLQGYALPLFLGIRFDGFSGLSGAPVFEDVFGHDDETHSLARAWPRADDGRGALAKTGIVLIDGARIAVVENDGATLTLRIVDPVPAGPFGVRQFGRSHFF